MLARLVLRASFLSLMVALGVTAGVGCAAPQRQASAVEEVRKPTLLLNMTSGTDDLHAATMALLTARRAREAGWPTILYFNVHAPPLAARDLPDQVALTGERPVKELLADAMATGARVFVCPHCMDVAGVKADRLVAGAEPATLDVVLERAGKSVISLSY